MVHWSKQESDMLTSSNIHTVLQAIGDFSPSVQSNGLSGTGMQMLLSGKTQLLFFLVGGWLD